jgi:hypothetical protein
MIKVSKYFNYEINNRTKTAFWSNWSHLPSTKIESAVFNKKKRSSFVPLIKTNTYRSFTMCFLVLLIKHHCHVNLNQCIMNQPLCLSLLWHHLPFALDSRKMHRCTCLSSWRYDYSSHAATQGDEHAYLCLSYERIDRTHFSATLVRT